MNKIQIIVDEACSITQTLIDKFSVKIVPLNIEWEEGNLRGVEMFQRMRKSKAMPKTSQPSMGAYKKFYEQSFAEGAEEIICITISSAISGTYNSAMQGKKFLNPEQQKKVFVVDTFNVDLGEGLLVIKAGELVEQGMPADEIVKKLEEIKNGIYLVGMIENVDYLERGGRISKTVANLLRQMQKIGMRPLLKIKKGKVKPATLKMQAKDTVEALFKELSKKADKKNVRLAISHTDKEEDANALAQKIKEELPNVKVEYISLVNPVIGSHVGPETLIFAFIEE